MAQLTEREFDVLILMANGMSNKQISEQLKISLHTTKNHVKSIIRKLESGNRTQAVAKAVNWGLLKINNQKEL